MATSDSASGHSANSANSANSAASENEELQEALVRISFAMMTVLSRVGAEHDLSLTQLRTLGILRDRRVRVTDLARYLGLDKSSVSGLVDRAVKRGLLERSPNALDGRAVDVQLTEQGRELAAIGAAEVAEALTPLTSTLTSAEVRRLTALLDRMLGVPGI
jgi:DNA-binding MarR family transcriptional regulator